MMRSQNVNELGEKKLLQRLRKYVSEGGVVLRSFSEDCAVVDAGGGRCQLLTVDVMIDGRHFRREWMPAYNLGRKAVNVNVSDVSAMAGRALFFLVSLGLPPDTPTLFVEEMYRGIESAARQSGLVLAGGNVSASPVLFIDITMIGEAAKDHLLLRKGAGEGDAILVTGPLGGSAAGLKLLESGVRLDSASESWQQEAIQTHLDPPVLQETASWLGECGYATSMMDLSDGLASDLPEICRESGAGALLRADQIPLAQAARMIEPGDPLQLALSGGEDYHLLFTVSRNHLDDFHRAARESGRTFFEIGAMVRESEGICLQDTTGIHPLVTGFQHFQP